MVIVRLRLRVGLVVMARRMDRLTFRVTITVAVRVTLVIRATVRFRCSHEAQACPYCG